MNDPTKQLIKGLISAIDEVVDYPIRTKIPIEASGKAKIPYPYVHISDIYVEENGTKADFRYTVECLVKTVYKDLTDKEGLWDDRDSILGIFNNGGSPFSITTYKIHEARLISCSEEEVMMDFGILNIGLIRLTFEII